MIIAIRRWLFLLPASLLFVAVSYPLTPFVVLFSNEAGWLPLWLWWFQTPDNSLDGDNGWRTEHWQFRRKLPLLARYIGRVGWLWRNPGYGLDRSVLGAGIGKHVLFVKGNPDVSNRPLVEGAVFRKVVNRDGSVYWQWYYVKAWSKTRCLRINLGWKLWGTLHAGDNRSFVFSLNPFMGYSV